MKHTFVRVGKISVKTLQDIANIFCVPLEILVESSGYGRIIFSCEARETQKARKARKTQKARKARKKLLYVATFPAQVLRGETVIIYIDPSFCSERESLESFDELPLRLQKFLDLLLDLWLS
ncbi:MAG: hypothetical protein WC805_03425 [Patescibacteria group bacterium]|jgi:hypothetical protein